MKLFKGLKKRKMDQPDPVMKDFIVDTTLPPFNPEYTEEVTEDAEEATEEEIEQEIREINRIYHDSDMFLEILEETVLEAIEDSMSPFDYKLSKKRRIAFAKLIVERIKKIL